MCNKRRATEPNNDIQHRHWLCCDWSGKKKKKKKKQYLISFSFIYSFLGWVYKIHSLNTLVLFKNGLKRPPWKKLNHRLSLGSYQKALSQARPADLHKLSIIFYPNKDLMLFSYSVFTDKATPLAQRIYSHFNGSSHNVQAISLFIIVFPLSLTAEYYANATSIAALLWWNKINKQCNETARDSKQMQNTQSFPNI